MNENSPSQSWFDRFWPHVVIASGVGYIALSYAVSRWLTRRSPEIVPAPTGLPDCTIESLQCRTTDGIVLNGWHIAPPNPRATVALFHGMRRNRASVLDRIGFLTAAGYRCIAFDHRAHGESGGPACSFGYHERHDVSAVHDLICARWANEPRAAIGVSMGAAALCFAADRAHGFDAVILESVYSDLSRAFDQRVGCGYPAWFQHFRGGVTWFTEWRMKGRIEDVAPIAYVGRLAPRPVLLITGSDDPHAPPDEVRGLAEQGGFQFHVISGAGHDDVCEQGGPVYQDLLLTFLRQRLLSNLWNAA